MLGIKDQAETDTTLFVGLSCIDWRDGDFRNGSCNLLFKVLKSDTKSWHALSLWRSFGPHYPTLQKHTKQMFMTTTAPLCKDIKHQCYLMLSELEWLNFEHDWGKRNLEHWTLVILSKQNLLFYIQPRRHSQTAAVFNSQDNIVKEFPIGGVEEHIEWETLSSKWGLSEEEHWN